MSRGSISRGLREERRPRPNQQFTFVGEDTGGTNPKIEVKDAHGVVWGVKSGEEVSSRGLRRAATIRRCRCVPGSVTRVLLSMVDQLADGMVLKPAVKYQRVAQNGVARDNHQVLHSGAREAEAAEITSRAMSMYLDSGIAASRRAE